MKSFKLIILFLFVSQICFSQNKKDLEQINTQIWQPFTKAFETLDYELFSSIHSKALIRVSGNQKNIQFFDKYLEGYKTRWKNSDRKQTISFRFFERIVGDQIVSERGVYRLTIGLGTERERHFYGQFHVLHKQIDGTWKIILDYDSTENNTINETSYNNAFAIDDFDKY